MFYFVFFLFGDNGIGKKSRTSFFLFIQIIKIRFKNLMIENTLLFLVSLFLKNYFNGLKKKKESRLKIFIIKADLNCKVINLLQVRILNKRS